MDEVRVGVIGCGAGTFHLEGYAEDPRTKIVALAGLDTARCQQIAKKFEVPEIYGDFRDLLEKADVEAVSVVVPNHLHLPIALAAFEAGKHVLVEKPLARTAAEGEQMVAAAKAAGKILAIAFQRRHRSDMVLLRQHIVDGGLGEIYYAKAHWMRRSGIPGLGTWFTSKELAGGGPLIDLGVHVLDMALWLMGNPKATSVSAATYAKIGPRGRGHWTSSRFAEGGENAYEVEDLATAFIRFDSGATMQLETCWAAHTGVTDEFGVSLMGDKGGAETHIKDYANVGTLRLFGDVAGVPVDATPRLRPTHGHAGIIRGFVDGIIHGTPVSPSGEEGVDRARLIDAIYHSAALGKEVTL
ncbi:MAG: Gfo/Idh/MocA family protein [Thermomicrobiales bacterium]